MTIKQNTSRIGPMSNYYIKEEYQIHTDARTPIDQGEAFWTPDRQFFAMFAGHYVYKTGARLVKRYGLRTVIDIGCGNGAKLANLIQPICRKVVGVDTEESVILCAQEYPGINFKIVDLNSPDLHSVRNERFDLVICRDVIEHLSNPNGCIEFIRTVSHSDTWILISTPERDILRGKDCTTSEKPDHVREWNKPEFAAYLTAQGFDIQWHRTTPAIKLSLRRKVLKRICQYLRDYGSIYIHQTVCAKLRQS